MIGDHGGGVDIDHRLVQTPLEIDAGRADDLRDDDTLGAVDDEGAAVGHDREITHEDFLFLDLHGLLVGQADTDLERGGIRGVAGLALLLGILGRLVHGVVDEAQLQVARIVGHGIHVAEDFVQSGVQEPLVGALLDFQQVRHLHDLIDTGIAHSPRFAVEDFFWHVRTLLFKTPGWVVCFCIPVLISQR